MRILISILLTLSLLACGTPEPRKPVTGKTQSFYKESIERSKVLLAAEEAVIKSMIESDSLREYVNSESGFSYYYETVQKETGSLPETDDEVTITYNLMTLRGDTLYSAEEIGRRKIVVDREELFPGMQQAIKILKEGEQATFLFPSSLAYGYRGDNDRIGINVPLKSSIAMHELKKANDKVKQ